jgi:hypothetical protein
LAAIRANDAAVTGMGGKKKLCDGGGAARRLALDAEPAAVRFEPRADDVDDDDASTDDMSGPTAGAASTFFGAGRRLGAWGAGVAAPLRDEVA